MKAFKRTITLALALLLGVTLLPAAVKTEAASTKTVYVVSKITIKEGSTTTASTLSYTDTGLIQKIDTSYKTERIKDTFTYNADNQLKKHVEKILTGDHKGSTPTTYTYNKNGQRTKKTDKYDDEKSVTKYTYNSKGQVAASTVEDRTTTYTYHKNGHVKKANNEDIAYTASFDDKGNITKWTRKFDTQKIGYYNATITYTGSGRVSKITKTFKNNPMQDKQSQTLTFSYTKVKVPAALADTIAEQQWNIINNLHGGAESFAW